MDKLYESRPEAFVGDTVRATVGCGHLYATVNVDEEGNVVELFLNLGKSGSCAHVLTEVIGRMGSKSLKDGRQADRIMKDLIGITCDKWSGSPMHCTSCADAAGRAIGRALGLFNDELQLIEKGGDKDGQGKDEGEGKDNEHGSGDSSESHS